MSIFEIVLISIGLAMDAFGVSIGKGLTMPVGENSREGHFGLSLWLVSVPNAPHRLAHRTSIYRCHI